MRRQAADLHWIYSVYLSQQVMIVHEVSIEEDLSYSVLESINFIVILKGQFFFKVNEYKM